MEKIQYTKYSNERSDEFAIRTDICTDGIKQMVRKKAMKPQGEPHIHRMCENYSKLKQLFSGTEFEVNHCEKKEGFAYFEYLPGRTLEERWDELVKAGKREQIEKEVFQYLEELEQIGEKQEFFVTPEFGKVFGKVQIPKGLLSCQLSNIDMLASNIILQEKKTCIDYEWTFDFPIPIQFVQFRVLHHYLLSSSTRLCLLDGFDWYGKVGISEELKESFLKMEEHFQQYIRGGYVSTRDLYPDMTPGRVGAMEAMELVHREKVSMIQIFWSKDGVMCEENSVFLQMTENHIKASYRPEEGTTCVRLDPGEHACVLMIDTLKVNGNEVEIEELEHNGNYVGQGKFFFFREDPHLIYRKETGIEKIEVELSVKVFLPEFASVVEQQRKQIENLQEYNQASKEKIEMLQEKIHQMENTKIWKFYRKYRDKLER